MQVCLKPCIAANSSNNLAAVCIIQRLAPSIFNIRFLLLNRYLQAELFKFYISENFYSDRAVVHQGWPPLLLWTSFTISCFVARSKAISNFYFYFLAWWTHFLEWYSIGTNLMRLKKILYQPSRPWLYPFYYSRENHF